MAAIQPYLRKVQFYETDAMGIVHHSNYIRWFEEARVDFMQQLGYGYDRTVREGVDVPILGVHCDYLTMTRFGESVRITMRIVAMSFARMTIAYDVADDATGELRATGETKHCFYKNGRATSLKKALPELHELLWAQFEQGQS